MIIEVIETSVYANGREIERYDNVSEAIASKLWLEMLTEAEQIDVIERKLK